MKKDRSKSASKVRKRSPYKALTNRSKTPSKLNNKKNFTHRGRGKSPRLNKSKSAMKSKKKKTLFMTPTKTRA